MGRGTDCVRFVTDRQRNYSPLLWPIKRAPMALGSRYRALTYVGHQDLSAAGFQKLAVDPSHCDGMAREN
jgi:hypothetical protein